MSDWASLTYDEKAAKARRAAEVLAECGWLFDEVVTVWTAGIVSSAPGDSEKREQAYQHIRAVEYMREHLAGYGNQMALESARQENRKE